MFGIFKLFNKIGIVKENQLMLMRGIVIVLFLVCLTCLLLAEFINIIFIILFFFSCSVSLNLCFAMMSYADKKTSKVIFYITRVITIFVSVVFTLLCFVYLKDTNRLNQNYYSASALIILINFLVLLTVDRLVYGKNFYFLIYLMQKVDPINKTERTLNIMVTIVTFLAIFEGLINPPAAEDQFLYFLLLFNVYTSAIFYQIRKLIGITPQKERELEVELNKRNLGERIAAVRGGCVPPLSEIEFAQLLNKSGLDIKDSEIKKWESGKIIPKQNQLEQIAQIGNTSIPWLCWGGIKNFIEEYLTTDNRNIDRYSPLFEELSEALYYFCVNDGYSDHKFPNEIKLNEYYTIIQDKKAMSTKDVVNYFAENTQNESGLIKIFYDLNVDPEPIKKPEVMKAFKVLHESLESIKNK